MGEFDSSATTVISSSGDILRTATLKINLLIVVLDLILQFKNTRRTDIFSTRQDMLTSETSTYVDHVVLPATENALRMDLLKKLLATQH